MKDNISHDSLPSTPCFASLLVRFQSPNSPNAYITQLWVIKISHKTLLESFLISWATIRRALETNGVSPCWSPAEHSLFFNCQDKTTISFSWYFLGCGGGGHSSGSCAVCLSHSATFFVQPEGPRNKSPLPFFGGADLQPLQVVPTRRCLQ